MFEGITTALITPLNNENEIDEESLKSLIHMQMNKGVHNLLALGGTGEYNSLNDVQKKRVIDITISEVNGRVPVLVGIVEPGIGSAIDIGLYAQEKGADGLLVVTPFYVRPTQEGIIEYYDVLGSALDIPILLYNMPTKTGVNMLPETVSKIVDKNKNIVGIKECSTDFSQTVKLIQLVGDKITVLAGEEYAAVASMIFGAKGAIMASANLIPKTWVDLYDATRNGNIKVAIDKNTKLYPIFDLIFMEGNPIPLKAAMKLMNYSSEHVNLPLENAKQSTVDALNNAIATIEKMEQGE